MWLLTIWYLMMLAQNCDCEHINFDRNQFILRASGSKISDNSVILYSNKERSKRFCDSKKNTPVDLDYLRKQQLVSISFSDKKLCKVPRAELTPLIDAGKYRKIKSRFLNKQLHIPLSLNWKEHYFIFDTGYQGTFTMKLNKKLKFLERPHDEVDVIDHFNSKEKQIIKYFQNIRIGFGGILYNTAVSVSDCHKETVGIGFIKGFDWIIDFEKEVVYVKKNSNGLDTGDMTVNRFMTAHAGETLYISGKFRKEYAFKLKDEIYSVNGKRVTFENICEMEHLLMTNNWDDLALEIKPR